MVHEEKVNFLELITGLAEIFDKNLSPVVIEIYWNALKRFSLDDFKRAVNNIIETHVYATFPKPAQFIEFINPPEDIEFKAEQGLKEWIDAYCDKGIYENVEFKDPVVTLVCQHFGGWVAICNAFPRYGSARDQEFWHNNFKKLYMGYAKRQLPDEMPKMIGLHEVGNADKALLLEAERQKLLEGKSKHRTYTKCQVCRKVMVCYYYTDSKKWICGICNPDLGDKSEHETLK